MNHLRELLDALPYEVGYDDHWNSPDAGPTALKMSKVFGEKAVCFSIGDIASMSTLVSIPELCRLPFESCWFEAEFKSKHIGTSPVIAGILCSEIEDDFSGSVFLRQSDKRWSFEGIVRAKPSLRDPDCAFEVEMHPDSRQGAHALLIGVLRFLSAMNCTNVGRQEHKPDAALQKARAKRGKQPLFSYWTLELNGRDGGAAQSFGGTHASPRVHLRRGHPRQYAPGKWTWVQPHAVGNRELGMVHKDYVIGKEMVVH